MFLQEPGFLDSDLVSVIKPSCGKSEDVCLYVCIHTYMHPGIHPFINTYVHTCIHTYIHTYMHTYRHTYIHIHTAKDAKHTIHPHGYL